MPPFQYSTYTVSNSASTVTNDNTLYAPNWSNGTIYVDATAFGDPQKSYIYRGDPIHEVRGGLVEGAAREETPEAWLKRRVEEICWRPA